MNVFRAYIVGPDGRFSRAEVLDCTTDEAAINAARKFVDGHDVEIWQGDRRVARLNCKEAD